MKMNTKLLRNELKYFVISMNIYFSAWICFCFIHNLYLFIFLISPDRYLVDRFVIRFKIYFYPFILITRENKDQVFEHISIKTSRNVILLVDVRFFALVYMSFFSSIIWERNSRLRTTDLKFETIKIGRSYVNFLSSFYYLKS